MRKLIDNILRWTLIALMGLLIVDVLWQVTSRYVMSHPSSFTDELAAFLLIWVGLLGSAYLCSTQEHLAIDLLVQRINPKHRKAIEAMILLVTFLFAASILVVGGTWAVYTRYYLTVTSAALQINLGYVYLALPISGVLICYYTIDNAINLLNNHKIEEDGRWK